MEQPASAVLEVLDDVAGVFSDGFNQFLGASPDTLNGWNCTAGEDRSAKEPPVGAGGGSAGYCERGDRGEVFVYHEEGTRRRCRPAASPLAPPAEISAAAAEDSTHTDILTQTLLANTFFAAQGRSLQEMLESKGQLRNRFKSVSEWRSAVLRSCNGHDVRVPTMDGRSLDAIWVPAGPATDHGAKKAASKACCVFHPNFAVCLDMVQYAVWYSKHGFGVLLVTMGGYAGSPGDTTELSTYFDAHAAVQYVQKVRAVTLHRIICHGISIGGALASAAACVHRGVHCTVDQTFVNATEVAEELLASFPDWKRHTPKWLIATFISAIFPQGDSDQRLQGVVTDGYNNLTKAAFVQGHYFAIYASQDHMMPKAFAERLVKTHYASVMQQVISTLQHQGDTPLELLRSWLIKFGWYTEEDSSRDGEALKDKLRTVCEQSSLEEIVSRRLACILGGHHGAFFADDVMCEATYLKYLASIGLVE